MKDRQKRKLKKVTLVLGGTGAVVGGGALAIYACWPQIKTFLKQKLDERNDRVRPAIQEAKDRKAAVAAEQKKLKKAKKKYDKKVKKIRQKQATRVYDEYMAKGYEPTADMIHEAASIGVEARKDAEAKKDELQAQSDARVEKAVADKRADREKKAIARAEGKQTIQLKDGQQLTVSSTVRPEDVAK